jgi:transketolase
MEVQAQTNQMQQAAGKQIAGGALGQGICFSLGIAFACRLDRKSCKVYAMIGDGECQEGSVWEASMAASFHKLYNLIVILDKNQVQQTGKVKDVMDIGDVELKWKAFGWNVLSINGHDMSQIVKALDEASDMKNKKPTIILSNTIKGKGVSFMELNHKFHGKAPNEDEYKKAIEEIEWIDVKKFK